MPPPMARRLTTRDAWLELAVWWDHATRCKTSGKMAAQPYATGLCATLGIMRFRGLIDYRQEEAMLAALPARGRLWIPGVRPYLWPTDEDGAKQRAEFCREQAG